MQRAERLFLCANKPLSELPLKVFAKGGAPATALSDEARGKRLALAKRIALIECKALAVVESLGAVVEDTYHWVEKKLAQNYEELKEDIAREDFDIGEGSSDDEVRCLRNVPTICCRECACMQRCWLCRPRPRVHPTCRH